MLEGKYVDGKIRERYENPNLFKPLVYVSLGVSGELEDLPASIGGLTYPLDTPISIAGKEEKTITVRSYSFDPTLAPEGKNVLIVQYETDFDYWKDLRQDLKRYNAEKERITTDIIAGLEQRFPGITGRVEMTDAATPVTWERYTGNWRGAYEGWMFDAESFTASMKKSLPGLGNFYMAGQWVNPGGGIPTAVMSGNHTIQLICRQDRKKFVTAKP
jgi:phytoene dehydrogenase-like protein